MSRYVWPLQATNWGIERDRTRYLLTILVKTSFFETSSTFHHHPASLVSLHSLMSLASCSVRWFSWLNSIMWTSHHVVSPSIQSTIFCLTYSQAQLKHKHSELLHFWNLHFKSPTFYWPPPNFSALSLHYYFCPCNLTHHDCQSPGHYS